MQIVGGAKARGGGTGQAIPKVVEKSADAIGREIGHRTELFDAQAYLQAGQA